MEGRKKRMWNSRKKNNLLTYECRVENKSLWKLTPSISISVMYIRIYIHYYYWYWYYYNLFVEIFFCWHKKQVLSARVWKIDEEKNWKSLIKLLVVEQIEQKWWFFINLLLYNRNEIKMNELMEKMEEEEKIWKMD